MIPWEWLVACKLQKIYNENVKSGSEAAKRSKNESAGSLLQFTCDNSLRHSLPLAATYHCEYITFLGGRVHVISKDWSTHEGNPRPTSITWVWSYISSCLLKHILDPGSERMIDYDDWCCHSTGRVWVEMLPQMPSTIHQQNLREDSMDTSVTNVAYPIHFATVNVWHSNTSVHLTKKLCNVCWIARFQCEATENGQTQTNVSASYACKFHLPREVHTYEEKMLFLQWSKDQDNLWCTSQTDEILDVQKRFRSFISLVWNHSSTMLVKPIVWCQYLILITMSNWHCNCTCFALQIQLTLSSSIKL